MPLNQAISAAKDIEALRAKLDSLQQSMIDLDAQRTRVQARIDEIRTEIAAKRIDLRNAASDL